MNEEKNTLFAEQYAKQYACKYLNDGDVKNLSDKNLRKCFKSCIISPRKEFYKSIRYKIDMIIFKSHDIATEREADRSEKNNKFIY